MERTGKGRKGMRREGRGRRRANTHNFIHQNMADLYKI